jgi:hypothetical protein
VYVRLFPIGGIAAIIAIYIIFINGLAIDDGRENLRQQSPQTLGNLDEKGSGEKSEYMLLESKPDGNDTPEAVIAAYFDTLKTAANLTDRQMAAAGGTVGSGLEAYRRAYRYWSVEWREVNSFQDFLDSWQGTASVELFKLLPAGRHKERARFFVETRHLEFVGDKLCVGIFYYTGFYTLDRTEEGWRIVEGSLEPQNLVWELSGHQPWRGDPVMVAIVDGLGLGSQDEAGKAVVRNNPDGTVVVDFSHAPLAESRRFVLYRPFDGMWRIIEKCSIEQEDEAISDF